MCYIITSRVRFLGFFAYIRLSFSFPRRRRKSARRIWQIYVKYLPRHVPIVCASFFRVITKLRKNESKWKGKNKNTHLNHMGLERGIESSNLIVFYTYNFAKNSPLSYLKIRVGSTRLMSDNLIFHNLAAQKWFGKCFPEYGLIYTELELNLLLTNLHPAKKPFKFQVWLKNCINRESKPPQSIPSRNFNPVWPSTRPKKSSNKQKDWRNSANNKWVGGWGWEFYSLTRQIFPIFIFHLVLFFGECHFLAE